LATVVSTECVLEVLSDTEITAAAAKLRPEGTLAAVVAVRRADVAFKELAAATALRKCGASR
jgi:hypothetical protein